MAKRKFADSSISHTNSTDNRPRRRWLNIGPGLIIAVILSIFIGVNWYKADKQSRSQHSGPPIVERQTISSSYEEKTGPTPEIGFILSRKDKIRLTGTQVSQLRKMEADWKKYYGPKLAQANEAARKTNDYLADSKSNRRTPVTHIQKEAAPLVALSGEISSARRSYWDRASKLLDHKQREIVQKERELDWTAKKAALVNSRKRIGN